MIVEQGPLPSAAWAPRRCRFRLRRCDRGRADQLAAPVASGDMPGGAGRGFPAVGRKGRPTGLCIHGGEGRAATRGAGTT